MGYAATTNVIYGVELDGGEMEAFANEYALEAVNFGAPQEEIEEDPQGCCTYFGIDYLVARGEGGHSIINDTEWYNPDDDMDFYTMGFELGGKGYGCNDDVVKLIKSKPTAKMKADWDNVIGPILKNIGINKKPKMLITNQTH